MPLRQPAPGPVALATSAVRGAVFTSVLAALVAGNAGAAEDTAPRDEAATEEPALGELSLEEMLNVEVTSVSKKAESAFTAPSAIAVITGDDIRRSGATTIAEALRLVPGLDVARINSNTWGITSRGLNSQFANKLLVLIDGRDVYNPIFAGTFWDTQDVLLEDVERIEVIRGPGGTLWGANAVNGVINVITKPASKTHGLLAFGGGGSYERAFGGARWGGAVGENFHYRGYAKYWDRSSFEEADGSSNHDGWSQSRGGARFDWGAWENGNLTLQGDYYSGIDHPTLTEPVPAAPYSVVREGVRENHEGGNVVGRLEHRFSETSSLEFQAYWDRWRRSIAEFNGYKLTVDTVDLRFQHRFGLPWSSNLIWGAEYRRYDDETKPAPAQLFFFPQNEEYELVSGFLQAEVPLIKDQLTFTAGTKLEYNEFSNFEYQPSARLAWHPHERHFLWAAVSRAVRTPSRADRDLFLKAQDLPIEALPGLFLTGLVRARGNPQTKSESLLSWEGGYRVRPWETAMLDIAAFYNDYHHLAELTQGTPRIVTVPGEPLPFIVIPTPFQPAVLGTTYGVETSFTWQVVRDLRFVLNYSYLEAQTRLHDGYAPVVDREGLEDSTPHHQVGVRSFLNLPYDLELDALVWYTDQLPRQVPSWVRLDLRLGWRPVEQVELAVVGQNLTDDSHPELNTGLGFARSGEYPRGVYGRVTIRTF